MSNLQHRLILSLTEAGPRGISSDQFGDEIALSVASTLSAMVRAGLAWAATAAGKNRQRRWFATEAWRDEYATRQEALKQPRKRVGRPLGGIKWAADVQVVMPAHVVVQTFPGPALGLRTNTHRNGL